MPSSTQSSPTLGVLAIFRDEAHIAAEWLHHLMLEGVSQFVLLDEGSSDNGRLIVEAYAARVPVNLSIHAVTRASGDQVDQYNRHLHWLHTEWTLVCDLDEFVFARAPFTTISSFLASLLPSVRLIALPWKLFGTSGVIAQPFSAIASFTRRYRSLDPKYECNTKVEFKSLFRTRALKALPHLNGSLGIWHQHRAIEYRHTKVDFKSLFRTPALKALPNLNDALHWPESSGARPVNFYHDLIKQVGPIQRSAMASWGLHINHYQLESCELYARVKMTRGSVTRSQRDRARDWNYFRRQESVLNRVPDEELRRKRGGDAWVEELQRLGMPTATWPTLARTPRHAAQLAMPMAEIARLCERAPVWRPDDHGLTGNVSAKAEEACGAHF